MKPEEVKQTETESFVKQVIKYGWKDENETIRKHKIRHIRHGDLLAS
jgi:hypothetical protein